MLLVALSACAPDDVPPEPVGLAPQFAPEDGATTSSSPGGPAPAAEPADLGSPSTTAVGSFTPAAASGAETLRATTTDARGDLTPAVGDAAPAWADLTGAELIMTARSFELRVTLGGDAPAQSPDGDHTMNVAAFFDVDGDGALDYEVWANLASGGWGGAWYDDRAGTAAFVDESGVTVAPEGGALVVRFPADHLGGATWFRWSIASEWGRHATIGTVAAARDDAPDGDAPMAFPS